MFRRNKERKADAQPARPDYRDGREFDPTDPTDGRARVILTEVKREDGTFVYHTDSFNLDPAMADEFILFVMQKKRAAQRG